MRAKEVNDNLIDEVLTAVGRQFANTEGPDFVALTTTPGLLILSSQENGPEKVYEIMKTVAMGIDLGVEQVVADIGMEPRFERAVQNVVRDGLRGVYEQFNAYYQAGAGTIAGGGSSAEGGKDDTAGWAPERFEEAVCCMEGMPCFDGDFANAAGRGEIEEEIAWREVDLEWQKADFDRLNAERERAAADARAIELADTRQQAGKLSNQIEDSIKRENKARTALEGLEGAALEDQ